MKHGHISLSKGHVEANENEQETAKREIFEETSLSPLIDDINFRKIITYSPEKNVSKDVIFFVAKCVEDLAPIDKHDNEVVGFIWSEFIEAYDLLTHESDKDVLRQANLYILNKEKSNLV